MNRFQFVADHQHAYMVKRLCEAVEVSRSSFYAWCAAAPARAERAAADAELAERIRIVQDPKAGGDPAYGAPRVTAELNDGVPLADRVNHKRVARVMKAHDLAGIRLRRRVKTTVPEPADTRSTPTCSSGTSPPKRPTSATSATSPTYPYPRAATCTWPP